MNCIGPFFKQLKNLGVSRGVGQKDPTLTASSFVYFNEVGEINKWLIIKMFSKCADPGIFFSSFSHDTIQI